MVEFPFSGRASELENLNRILDKALKGEGSLGFITGEPGVGKTRLAQELLEKAGTKGFYRLTAKCPKGGSLLPYFVWVECLRQLTLEMSVREFFEVCGNFSRQILKLLPELDTDRSEASQRAPSADQKPSGTELGPTSPVQIFDAVTQFFHRFSSRSPLILLLDDMQWCDKTSLGLLRFLASGGFRNRRLVILCVYRDIYIQTENPDFHRLVSEFSTSETSKVVRLERFDLQGAKNLIRSVNTLTRVSDSFCGLVYRKTGGNPLFMRELVALLGERANTGDRRSAPWESVTTSEIVVPETVKEVVKQRLAPLDSELVEVLKVAALIGEEFDLGILRQASNARDEVRLFELIQAASETGIVRRKRAEPGQVLYSFDDEVTMDLLTETISPERLTAYHLAIGRIMEHVYAERIDERAAELALHFRNGGDWGKCFEYSIKAGDFAAATYAHNEASNHYVTALQSLDKLGSEGPVQARGRTLERAADEFYSLGRALDSFTAWEEAIKQYEVAGDFERAAQVHSKIGFRYTIAYRTKETPEKALRHFEAAEHILEQGHKGAPLAYLYHHFATWHWYHGEIDKAREYCEKSIEIADKHGITGVEALCSTILGLTSRIDDIETAMKHFKRAEQLSMERETSNFDITPIAGHVHYRLGWGYNWATHDTPAALAHFLEAVRISERVGGASGILYAQLFATLWGYLPLGEWSKAKEILSDALASPLLESYYVIRLFTFTPLGTIYLLEGELADAEKWLLKGYAEFEEIQRGPGWAGYWVVPYLHASLARLYLDRGDLNRAERYLRHGYAGLKGRALIVDSALGMAIILTLLVEVCERQERRDEALSYLHELEGYVKLTNQDWARANYRQSAGYIASEMEEWEKALENYEEAARCWKVLSHPYELAKVYYELAQVHLNMGRIETANGLFENARDIFEKLGARLDLKKVTTAKAAIEDKSAFSILRLRGLAKENSRSVFDYLVTAFIGDYYAKKLSPESSGWRTLGDIARQTKLPASAFYQKDSKKGGGLGELERMGLVEVRLYSGQRGRGGKITRVRIAYEREEIKKHLARRITKVSRSLGSEAEERQ